MVDFTDTEEMICPDCNKSLMFTEISPGKLQAYGCGCAHPPEHVIPPGAIVTNLGGLWVVRRPKHRQ